MRYTNPQTFFLCFVTQPREMRMQLIYLACKTTRPTSIEVFVRSGIAVLPGRDAMLARRRLDTLLALCGVGAISWYSVITLGGRTPASYASSWNSDSSGNVSLHHATTSSSSSSPSS